MELYLRPFRLIGKIFPMIFLLHLFMVGGTARAQQEAEAREDVQFQHLEHPKRIKTIAPGMRVGFPVTVDDRMREMEGTVTEVRDSVIVVTRSKTNILTEINLNRTPYISIVRNQQRKIGKILFWTGAILGFLTFLLVALTIIIIAASLGLTGVGWALIIAFLLCMINLLTVPGAILYFTSVKRLWRHKWTHRPRKVVTIYRKESQK